MINEEGNEVKVIDDEEHPEIELDEKTGKKIIRKSIINENGKIEKVKEIVESDVESEYDENGNKLPKKKKYINKKGKIITLEEPVEESEEEEYQKPKDTKIIKKDKKTKEIEEEPETNNNSKNNRFQHTYSPKANI